MSRVSRVFGGALRWGLPCTVGAALVVWLLLPWPLVYRWRDPDVTSLMQYRERQWKAEGRSLELRHEWAPLDDIPSIVTRAVVVAEDDRFREHGGVDWAALGEELKYDGESPFSWFDASDRSALWRALRYGWTHRSEVRGRSTITQQLAKNLYFTPERSFGRKLAEYLVTWRLEWLLGKDRILELYLNSVELGPGVFGVGAAAREYFGKPVEDLGAWEAASLAATLPHPLTSNPSYRPGRMAWRRDLILGRLRGGSAPIPAEPPELVPPEPTLPRGLGGAGAGGGDTGADTLNATEDTLDAAGGTLGVTGDTLGVAGDARSSVADTLEAGPRR